MRGWRGPRGSFADWVAKAAPMAVEFPAPNVTAGRKCRSDRFSIGYWRSAELGMGFFLATDFNEIDDRLNVVTPMLFHSAAPISVHIATQSFTVRRRPAYGKRERVAGSIQIVRIRKTFARDFRNLSFSPKLAMPQAVGLAGRT